MPYHFTRHGDCERCGEHENLQFCEGVPDGEYLCGSCVDKREADGEREAERLAADFHDGGSTAPWPDMERERMEEARRLK